MTPRQRLALVAIPIAVLSAAGLTAAAFTPLLLRDNPHLLLVLESRNRYLLLAGARVGIVAFVVIGVLRRFASDPFYYLAGRWYGDRAVAWAEQQMGAGRTVALIERTFQRFADVAVLLFPGALVCALAGATGMSPRRFVALNLGGTLATVLVLRLVVDAAAGPLGTIVAFSDRNAGWLTAVFVVVTILWVAGQQRRGSAPGLAPAEADVTDSDLAEQVYLAVAELEAGRTAATAARIAGRLGMEEARVQAVLDHLTPVPLERVAADPVHYRLSSESG